MKNMLDAMNSRLEEAKEHINDPEDRVIENKLNKREKEDFAK